MFSNPEYVYEVYKERSFSKAAKNLFISQPALSVTIKRIENRIGCPIFDRSTNPVGLTECGEKYIEVIKQYMDLQNGFMNYLSNLEELKIGNINVGGSNLFTSCILPPIIARFTNRYPTVEINVVEANTSQLDSQLMDGTLDLILDNYSFDTSTHASTLYRTESLILAVPSSFPVNRGLEEYRLKREDVVSGAFRSDSIQAVPFHSFDGLPFIFLKSGNDTRDRAMKIFDKNKMKPNIILNLDQQMTAYNVCCQGMGITFITDTLVSRTHEEKNVRLYPLAPALSTRSLCFFRKKAKYVTRAMEEFLKIAGRQAES